MDARLDEAFAAVPRRDFLPADQRRFASRDVALGIGYGVTNSQPTTVRNMLELLSVAPGQRVLDVGSGSGWTTALLAHLVGPTGEVVGVEVIPEILQLGRSHLGERFPQASLHLAEEGVLGWPARAPYDRILVSAAARKLPQALLAQLGIDAVLVVPVAGVMHRVVNGPGGFAVERHGRYAFVPLMGG